MYQLTITVESEEEAGVITQVLVAAQHEEIIDFPFELRKAQHGCDSEEQDPTEG